MLFLIRLFFYATSEMAQMFTDSVRYAEFDFTKLLKLDFSDGRTPVYPFVIRIMEWLFPQEMYLDVVCYLQIAVSFVALIYFYKTLKLITDRNGIALGITVMYGLSEAVWGWDTVILTESFALSGTVFFLYAMLNYLKSKEWRYGVIAILILLVLTFLRPSFLMFDVITTVFFVLHYLITRNKDILKIFFVSVGVWVFILLYSFLFYKSVGIFTISNPMPRQMMMVCLMRDYYLNTQEDEITELLMERLDEESSYDEWWPVIKEVRTRYGESGALEYAKNCIKDNLKQYMVDEVVLSVNTMQEEYGSYAAGKRDFGYGVTAVKSILLNFFKVLSPMHALCIAGMCMMHFLCNFYKHRRVDFLALGLAWFPILIFVSTIMATCAEYIRTMIHMFPFVYLGMMYLLDNIIQKNETFTEKLPSRKS